MQTSILVQILHLFCYAFTSSNNILNKYILQGLNMPGLAHGKMYKRYTFGASCPSLRSRFGVSKQKT